MLILGIETSCDDTAAAVVEDGCIVRSSIVASQDDIHSLYGGIVPELASRRHIEMVIPVVERSLKTAGVSIGDIDGVAVTQGPGLVGSILIGLSFAKSLSYSRGLPLTGVNHIEAHPMAAFLSDIGQRAKVPEFPFVALVVSGGHTTLLYFDSFTSYKVIGQTLDDAAGEAFDKVAKLLGLGYPGGGAIERVAKKGTAARVALPRPLMSKGSLDFSFSGLKTAVLNVIKGRGTLTETDISDIAAGFQEAAVDTLVQKAIWSIEATDARSLILAGGVACNQRLRDRLSEAAIREGFSLSVPEARFCSDNGAMIAALGYHQIAKGALGNLEMNASPTWEGF